MADVTFGVEAAARQFGLDFMPLVTEDYFFVCRRSFLETGLMQGLLGAMKSEAFHAAIAGLPGYAPADTGSVLTVTAFLESAEAE